MSEEAFKDDDPSVYRSHVLYVAKHDPNCKGVVSRLDSFELGDHVFIQDVMTLAQRPPWLRGVPSLLNTTDSKVFTGTRDIVAYASSWSDPHVSLSSSISTIGGSAGGLSLGASGLFEENVFTIEGESESATLSSFNTSSKPQGERATRRAAMADATSSAVEQMQQARAQMDRRFHTTNHPGRIPAPRNMMEAPRDVPVPQQRRGFGEW